jgi:hypothetical protein
MATEQTSDRRPRQTATNATTIAHVVARVTGGADPRSYNRLFAAIAIPPVLVMLILALTQQPLSGDLTRPGGYTEAEYGWNLPQERFSPPLVSTRYDKPYDIIVLGDSFSHIHGGQTDPGAFWTNFVAQSTGSSVVVLTRFDITLTELLQHPIFVRTPPYLLILETVERYLVRDYVTEVEQRVGQLRPTCRTETKDLPPLPTFRAIRREPAPWVRDTAPTVDFDQAANFLWKAVLRHGLGIDNTPIVQLGLTRSDFFSNRASNQLLIYDDELTKVPATTPQALDQVYCTLLEAQTLVQGNSRTRFLFMPAPDKVTAYADFLEDKELRHISALADFDRRDRLNQVDLVAPLRQAIRCGIKDVYMPNDTHWSSRGHRIVADAVIGALTGSPRWSAHECPPPRLLPSGQSGASYWSVAPERDGTAVARDSDSSVSGLAAVADGSPHS